MVVKKITNFVSGKEFLFWMLQENVRKVESGDKACQIRSSLNDFFFTADRFTVKYGLIILALPYKPFVHGRQT
jgi:hypothetical protein